MRSSCKYSGIQLVLQRKHFESLLDMSYRSGGYEGFFPFGCDAVQSGRISSTLGRPYFHHKRGRVNKRSNKTRFPLLLSNNKGIPNEGGQCFLTEYPVRSADIVRALRLTAHVRTAGRSCINPRTRSQISGQLIFIHCVGCGHD